MEPSRTISRMRSQSFAYLSFSFSSWFIDFCQLKFSRCRRGKWKEKNIFQVENRWRWRWRSSSCLRWTDVWGGQRVSGTVGPGAGIKSSQIFPKVTQSSVYLKSVVGLIVTLHLGNFCKKMRYKALWKNRPICSHCFGLIILPKLREIWMGW